MNMQLRKVCAGVILALLVLPACGIFKVVGSSTGGMGFEDESGGEAPAGWELDSTVIHRLTVDSSVAKSGTQSLSLRHAGLDDPEVPKVDDDQAMATHCVDAARFQGASFVRLSIFLRVEGGSAGLWFRGVTNEQGAYGPPHVQTGVLQPKEWTKYQLVATRRQAARTDLCIHLILKGVGTLWADDLSVARFDPSRYGPEKRQPIPLPNLDMESAGKQGALTHWALQQPAQPGLQLRADPEVKRSGSFGGRLEDPDDPTRLPSGAEGSPSGAEYCADPGPFDGKTVRVSMWARTMPNARPTSQLFLFLRGNGDPKVLEPLQNSPFSLVFREDGKFTTEWTQFDLIGSVPTGLTKLCFGFDLMSGTVFVDDVAVEIIEL